MRTICDFHIHSQYARATSKAMNLEGLDEWAEKKGISVISSADFTHPVWFSELKSKLEEAEPGLYRLRGSTRATRFILTTEISCIYSKGGAVRRIHLLLFAPSLEAVAKINAELGWRGNLKSDGRPILGLDALEVAKIVFAADERCLVVPAHAWTPWFSVFGSKSGFNSLEECFEDLTPRIYAIETGLSSDPAMNWRLSALDNITLLSNSDSHSLPKIGREANVFDLDALSYDAIVEVIKTRKGFSYTVEFFPEEGKYHYDGHRLCHQRFSPVESKARNNICPSCGKPLTIGVLNRVDELADRKEGARPAGAVPYKSMIPLGEIIADAMGQGTGTKQVVKEYERLVSLFTSEFQVLLDIEEQELRKIALPEVAEGIMRVREGKVRVEPGYDGEYGVIRIFGKDEDRTSASQGALL
ncbi:MAG: endonuclease Q family protein [bacterium]|nr:endonuclease Q family protein [bacterium]MDZ4231909.1 endonuclease Q family protein [Candidatus Pacearchaeota archaeon]